MINAKGENEKDHELKWSRDHKSLSAVGSTSANNREGADHMAIVATIRERERGRFAGTSAVGAEQ
eukprot:11707469-Heterocapsa_arctica.AAC.1